MRIDIITVLPELLDGPLNNSILKRAQDKGLAEIVVHNLRDLHSTSIVVSMIIPLVVKPAW